jgi:hypothetical protein
MGFWNVISRADGDSPVEDCAAEDEPPEILGGGSAVCFSMATCSRLAEAATKWQTCTVHRVLWTGVTCAPREGQRGVQGGSGACAKPERGECGRKHCGGGGLWGSWGGGLWGVGVCVGRLAQRPHLRQHQRGRAGRHSVHNGVQSKQAFTKEGHARQRYDAAVVQAASRGTTKARGGAHKRETGY